MKKLLLSSFMVFGLAMSAQINIFSWGFDAGFPSTWIVTNQSSVASATYVWAKANFTTSTTNSSSLFGSGIGVVPSGQAGGVNSLAAVNYNSTLSGASSGATISNWLLTPAINVKNGDVVSFYTRKGTDGNIDYPDRLELRYSTAATTVTPASGPADIGSFTNVAVTVNPTLAGNFVYPKTWTKYSFTLSGIGNTEVPVTFAFRYFVTDGGIGGSNSDIIGIDTFSVDREATLGTVESASARSSVYPNPAKNTLNFNLKNNNITKIRIFNLAGQVVIDKTYDISQKTVDISSLRKGVYVISFGDGKSTESIKFIKE